MGDDRIRLVLPADAEYGRIARIAGSSIALRLGLTYRQVEDLRLAIDETVILLLRPDGPGDRGEIGIDFTIGDAEIVLDLSTTSRGDADLAGGGSGEGEDRPWYGEEEFERFDEIVRDTVDEYSVDRDEPRVHLVKRF